MASNSCFCVGPQGDAPVCPCRMRSVRVENGRYVETIDHGPVERKTGIEEWCKRFDAELLKEFKRL